MNLSLPIHGTSLHLDRLAPADIRLFLEKTQEDYLPDMTCRPVHARSFEERYESLLQRNQQEDSYFLGIYGESLMGQISLFDYNPRNRSIELGYRLLPEYRGQGIMRAALRLLLSELFASSLNKVYAQTASFNQASVALLESLRFHKDAILREHHEKDGALYDDYIYSMLASAWN